MAKTVANVGEYLILQDDIQMLREFVGESSENLRDIHQRLQKLQTTEDSAADLNEVFRHVHNMKCVSSFAGITDVTALAHQLESVIVRLRGGDMKIDPALVALLLGACDALGGMLLCLKQTCEKHSFGDLTLVLAPSEQVETIKSELVGVMNKQELPGEQEPRVLTAQGGSEADDALMAAIQQQDAGEVMDSFLTEADEHVDMVADQLLIRLSGNDQDADALADLFRRIHTIKGLLGVVLSLDTAETPRRDLVKELQSVFHSVESSLEKVRRGEIIISERLINLCYAAVDGLRRFSQCMRRGEEPDGAEILFEWRSMTTRTEDKKNRGGAASAAKAAPPRQVESVATASATIRVSEEKLNRLMNIVGEMSIGKNAFFLVANKLMMEYNLPVMAREVREAGQWVARMSSELEDSVMGIRMTEVKGLFQKFPRVVRDIAMQTGKKIVLEMEGEETELDKTIIEQIGDPLMHLVRNAADHGMEAASVRVAAGKDPQGKIVLRAYNRGKHVMIEVEDDGPGMDPSAIKEKAVQKGFITHEQAETMSKSQALQLIFLPGFSTAKTISDISGRGVGMDVVKTNVGNLKGAVLLDSEMGRGSKVSIQLPLTLAVSRGMLVESGDLSLIIPIEYIVEMVKAPRDSLAFRQGKMLFCHRGEVLGVACLAEVLGRGGDAKQDIVPVIILTDGKQRVGFTVGRLLSEMDVLVKPLPEYLSAIPGMGGATILGDGRVALVLNPLELIRMAGG
ncbi:MAG: chemotaxis protein CheA [Firmicutes bacterium]|nr:chemotaxis protein CheA [Bacillota bacterium]